MTAKWLQWWRQAPITEGEAQEHLKRLTEQECKVKALSEELHKSRQRNHFSEMVYMAIRRTSEER